MAQQRLLIDDFLRECARGIVLDVRSPAEYSHAHLPDAISLPLFTDEERKVVGTTYKQQSRQEAIKTGLDFFGPRMKQIVETVEGLSANRTKTNKTDAPLFIYCWRGGMRSAAIAWLLELYGYRVYLLAGGYKSFRRLMLQTLEMPYRFKIIGGYTGSGKTEVLQMLGEQNQRVIDLEGLANHKGSAFGSISMPAQPSQELFENLLAMKLREISASLPQQQLLSASTEDYTCWLEDESQRIGNINLPPAFYKTMRGSPVYFLDIAFEQRLQHLVDEYGVLPKEKLEDATTRIAKRLGGLETKTTLEHIRAGNFSAAFDILLKYYDKTYKKGLESRKDAGSEIHYIPATEVTPQNALLVTGHPELI